MIDNRLPDSARRPVLRGKSEHTLRAYPRAFGWWVRFAEQHHITTMPAPQNAMIRMLDSWELLPVHVKCAGGRQADGTPCGGHRPSPSAVWIWYSAMKWFHGIGEPPLPWEGEVKLADAITDYTKRTKDDGWSASKAPWAFPHEIRGMVDAAHAVPDTVLAPARRDMIAALVLIGYLTGDRALDLARYRLSDIEYLPGGIQLTLARSKASKGDKNEE